MNHNALIEQLKTKIRNLQDELCERTRNYLLHNGLRNAATLKKIDQEIQTDHLTLQLSNSFDYLYTASPSFQSQNNSIQKQSAKQAFRKNDVSEFLPLQNELLSQNKIKISTILQQLQSQQRNLEESFQQTSFADSFSSQTNLPEEFNRQKRRLRRQIKNLKAKLDFQIKISQIAKEGLLISQQQNYQFRLKIIEILKSRNQAESTQFQDKTAFGQQIQALQSQITNIQLVLDHERQIKEQYLQTSLQLQDQIHRLTDENIKLKTLIVQFTQLNENQKQLNTTIEKSKGADYSDKYELIDQQVFEKIKNISYSISNCIPVTRQAKEVNYFKPETENEVLQVFQRVEEYCKQIQQWQIEKLDHLAKEKQFFIDFIKKISLHIDEMAKQSIVYQLMKIQQMAHFLSIFKQKETCFSHSTLFQTQDNAKSFTKQQQIRQMI